MLPDLSALGEVFRGGARDARDTFLQQIDRVVHHLGQIEHAIERLDTYEETRQVQAAGDADDAGAITLQIDGPRSGFAWKVERITTHVVSGAASIATIYVGSISPGNARLIIPDADFYVEAIAAPIHVSANAPLILVLSGAPVNAKVTLAAQVVEVRVD